MFVTNVAWAFPAEIDRLPGNQRVLPVVAEGIERNRVGPAIGELTETAWSPGRKFGRNADWLTRKPAPLNRRGALLELL